MPIRNYLHQLYPTIHEYHLITGDRTRILLVQQLDTFFDIPRYSYYPHYRNTINDEPVHSYQYPHYSYSRGSGIISDNLYDEIPPKPRKTTGSSQSISV